MPIPGFTQNSSHLCVFKELANCKYIYTSIKYIFNFHIQKEKSCNLISSKLYMYTLNQYLQHLHSDGKQLNIISFFFEKK